MSVGTTIGQDCFESYGLDPDQENVIPESVLSNPQTEVHDMVKGVSEGNPLRKRRTRLLNHPIQKQHPPYKCADIRTGTNSTGTRAPTNYQPLFCKKLPKSLTATLPVIDGKTEKVDLFEDFFNTSLKMYPHLTEEEMIN